MEEGRLDHAVELDPLLGRTIEGKYLIEELLGSGAMGSVYRARQVALERSVAIKVMSPALAKDASFVARFHREARTASRLWHPNTVGVTDFGEAADGLLYLVMELVPGQNLDTILQDELPLPDERIVAILAQVLSAVAAAHDLGIVHRDLKPENLLVVRGIDDDGAAQDIVKVCDFGLARGTGIEVEEDRSAVVPTLAGPTVTTVGLVLGTPAYMSPEQAAGLAPEKRSDLYAVGAILYEMLTKALPFERATLHETVLAHVNDPPPDPRTLVPDCNPALAALCLRALAKNPDERPPTARAMRAAIQRALAHPEDALAALDDPRASESVYPTVPRTRSTAPNHVEATSTIAAETPAPRAPRRARWLILGALGLAAGTLYALARAPAAPRAEDVHAPTVTVAEAPPPAPSLTTALATAEPVSAPPPVASAAEIVTTPRRATPTPAIRASASAVVPAAPEPVVATPVEPPPPPVIAPVPPPPAPAPVAPPPPYVADAASATFTVADVSGTSRKTVAALVGHVTMVDCYRDALRALGRAEGGTGTMHLDIDEDGVITAATVKVPPALGAAGTCFRTRMLRQRLGRPPDTGSASSELSIQLTP